MESKLLQTQRLQLHSTGRQQKMKSLGQSRIRHGQLQAQVMISQQLNHQRLRAILQVQRLQQRLIM